MRQMRSLSARRVWIEIALHEKEFRSLRSLSARRVWIEMGLMNAINNIEMSLSARRVWIEILETLLLPCASASHSPRGGCGLKLK